MSHEDKPRTYWLDKLSLDENGWMDAIPVQESDEVEYPGQVKVIEYSAFENQAAQIKELVEALEFYGDRTKHHAKLEQDYSDVENDQGKKAREALKKYRGE